MIVEWFIHFVISLVSALADFLPVVELPAGIGDALGFAMTLNGILPVTEALAVATLALSVLALLFVYRVVKIIVSHIPLVGGSG